MILNSYWARVVGGSMSLFVALPLLVRAFGGEYVLGVYIGTGIAVLWYTVETYYLRLQAVQPLIVARIEDDQLRLYNVGGGPALFVRIEDITLGAGLSVRFGVTDVVDVKQQVAAQVNTVVDDHGHEHQTWSFVPALKPQTANADYVIRVRYEDLNHGQHESATQMGQNGIRLLHHNGGFMEGAVQQPWQSMTTWPWVSIASVVIAACALWVAVNQAQSEHQHKRLSVRPHMAISFNFNDQGAGFGMANLGLGPAVIKSFVVYVDDKLQPTWLAVLKALGISTTPSVGFSSVEIGQYEVPNQPRVLLWLEKGDRSQQLIEAQSRVRIDVCYCSLYDECERVTSRGGSRHPDTCK